VSTGNPRHARGPNSALWKQIGEPGIVLNYLNKET
jgi:hypothetical protein